MDNSENEKQIALDRRYIRMASIWAENSYCKRRQVGALIVKDKMIIQMVTTALLPASRTYAKTRTILPSLMCFMPKPMPSPK